MMTSTAHPATDSSATDKTWHIVRKETGHCDIVDQQEFSQLTNKPKTWGPFSNHAEAIAKRVGLIRARKCLPK